MRNLSFPIICIAVLSIISTLGCKKELDENINSSSNFFTCDSILYETPKGYIEYYGSETDNNSERYCVYFISSGLTYSPIDANVTGSGNILYLDLNSPSLAELALGTYTFDGEYYYGEKVLRSPGTLTDGAIFIGLWENTGNAFYEYMGKSCTGIVTITQIGEIYEITYRFTLAYGREVEGYYKGELLFNDLSSSGSKKWATQLKRNRLGFKR